MFDIQQLMQAFNNPEMMEGFTSKLAMSDVDPDSIAPMLMQGAQEQAMGGVPGAQVAPPHLSPLADTIEGIEPQAPPQPPMYDTPSSGGLETSFAPQTAGGGAEAEAGNIKKTLSGLAQASKGSGRELPKPPNATAIAPQGNRWNPFQAGQFNFDGLQSPQGLAQLLQGAK